MANRVDPDQMPHFATLFAKAWLSQYLLFQSTCSNCKKSLVRSYGFSGLKENIVAYFSFLPGSEHRVQCKQTTINR